MTDYIKKLTELRRHEQEARNYAPSSRWYVGLSHSIQHLALADTAANPTDQFLNAWKAIYNLYMIMHSRGDVENRTLSRWIEEIQNAPEIRKLAAATPTDLLAAVQKVEKALLWNAETKTWREAKTLIETWLQKKNSLSPEKACKYIFLIGRDIRNALSHPTFSPNASNVKKALSLAVDRFIPLAEAAIRVTIEHPPPGTTGRATAYRSFLYPFLKNSDSFFSDYYLERLFPDAELKTFDEDSAKQSLKELHKSFNQLNRDLLNADNEETKKLWCNAVLFPSLRIAAHAGVRIVAESGVFEPDYVLSWAALKGKPRREYQGKDAGRDLACLIWTLPWSSNLDAVVEDPNLGMLPIMEVAHRALTQSDAPWAVITNGQRLRLLYKGTAHKLRSFLEVNLAAIIDRRVDSDALLAYRYLLGLFSGPSFTEKDEGDNTLLDRVLKESERHGKEIGDELKDNVFQALEELGSGFLDYLRVNAGEMEAWRVKRAPQISAKTFPDSEELLTDIYHESLSLMYRLLFLFYAESRDLLPMESELYRETYSLESIRDEIISTHDDPDPKQFFSEGNSTLWERLKELFGLVNKGWRDVIPAYNGGLFDPEEHEFLEETKIGDYRLARAIDLLSRTRPRAGRARGEGRKKVTYRDLDVRHLGSIYEGILEYSARIAEEDLASIKRDKYEEYTPVSELSKAEKEQLKTWREANAENPDNPQLPHGCKITDLKEKGQYFLVYGGRESKRKSSGSYYTPDYIVQYIVENTLGPLVRGENREGELKDVLLTSDEILALKVLDPAMGSGHFLVAATEYLARAYGEAVVREGKDQDSMVSEEESIRYKRMVAERCIYGVDINQMAVELAKLSLWLFTMDRGRPLSFLNHHLKCGNSLIGAWIEDLGEPPEFDSKGRPKKRERSRNLNLFETRFREKVPLMVRDIFNIMNQETLSYKDIEAKKALDQAVEQMKQPFRNLADIYIGTYFGEEAQDYHNLLLNVGEVRNRRSTVAREHQAFHWELEFPEIFFDRAGRYQDKTGFDAVIGNPPYLRESGNKDRFNFRRLPFWKEWYLGKSDLYFYFYMQGIRLCIWNRGRLSFITPSTWLESTQGRLLRAYLSMHSQVSGLVDMSGIKVFSEADVKTLILVLNRVGSPQSSKFYYAQWNGYLENEGARYIEELRRGNPRTPIKTVEATFKGEKPWHIARYMSHGKNIEEVFHSDIRLGDIVAIEAAINTGADKVSSRNARLAPNGAAIGEGIFIVSKQELEGMQLTGREQKYIFQYAGADCARKYRVVPPKEEEYLLYIDNDIEIEKDSPLIFRHLKRYRTLLESRAEILRNPQRQWWELLWPRDRDVMTSRNKIVCPTATQTNRFALDMYGYVFNIGVLVLTPLKGSPLSASAVCGLLNSKLYEYWYRRFGQAAGSTSRKYYPTRMREIPVKVGSRDAQSIWKQIESLVFILSRGNGDVLKISKTIDDFVFDLYDVPKQLRNLIQEEVPDCVEI